MKLWRPALLLLALALLIPGSACAQPASDTLVELHFFVEPANAEFILWGSPEQIARGQSLASGIASKPFALERRVLLEGPVSVTFRAEGYLDDTRNYDLRDLAQSSRTVSVPPDLKPIKLTKKPSMLYLSLLIGGCVSGIGLALLALHRKRLAEKSLKRNQLNLERLQTSVAHLSGLLESLRGVSKEPNDLDPYYDLESLLESSVDVEAALVVEPGPGGWQTIYRWPGLADRVFARIPLPEAGTTGPARTVGQSTEWPNHVLTLTLTTEPTRRVVLCRSESAFTDKEIDLAEFCLFQVRQALEKRHLMDQARVAQSEFEDTQRRLLQVARTNAVGDLGAGVAHQLNTPLGAISLSIEGTLAMLKEVPKPVENLLKTGLEAIENCQGIIDKLLTLSREGLEEKQEVSLNEAAESCIRLLQHKAKEQGVQFELLAEDTVVVSGHQNEVRQLVMNLAKNALDASPSGSTVTLAVRNTPSGSEFKVTDRGHGMSPETLKRAFEPFYSTRTVAQGRGLGLNVCEEIALRHSAAISIDSQEGAGTEVTVLFKAR